MRTLRAVVDTNVVAHLLLGPDPFLREVEPFWAANLVTTAPSHWQAELANVIWLAVRSGGIDPARARDQLALAASLKIQTVSVSRLWAGALSASLTTGVAIDDTLFIELAVQRNCPLATFDQAVLRAFPGIAARPRDLL